MLLLPKLSKDQKLAVTRLEKASKLIVGAALVVGASASVLPDQTQAAMSSADTQIQGAMLLTPSSGSVGVVADHYSHSSHESHASHASHYSHYSSQYR